MFVLFPNAYIKGIAPLCDVSSGGNFSSPSLEWLLLAPAVPGSFL